MIQKKCLQALKNAFEAMGYVEKRDEAFEIMDKFNDLIIIHLRFLQPEIDLVSLRFFRTWTLKKK